MNAHDRRYLKRLVETRLNDAGAKQEPSVIPMAVDTNKHRNQTITMLKRFSKVILPVISFLWCMWVALPTWTLTLPSTSYRPLNPFTAVFTLTNSGYLPATRVKLECFENRVNYADGSGSGPLESKQIELQDISRNESRTFQRPQVVSGISVVPGVISPDEIKKEYEDTKKYLNENGHFPDEDIPFVWADFQFDVTYSTHFYPFEWLRKYRVVSRLTQNGTFVWDQVALDKKFEKAQWIEPPNLH
ncbi:MAG: hypothetical protein ACLQM6_07855 [Acidobacteriaceae bacterium]